MISATQVPIAQTAVQMIAATCRTSVRLRAGGPSGGGGGQFFLGGDASVSATSGYTFLQGQELIFDLRDGDELWAIRNANTAPIDVLSQV